MRGLCPALIGSLVGSLCGCDRVLGVDVVPSDAEIDAAPPDTYFGPRIDCSNLRPLPTGLRKTLVWDTFGGNAFVSAPSAVTIGVEPLVMYTVTTPADQLGWGRTRPGVPAGAPSTIGNDGLIVLDGAGVQRATLWYDRIRGLSLAYERAGVTYISTPVTTGLDGQWKAPAITVPIPAGANLRSVGHQGGRVVIEVETPYSVTELLRDPATDQLVELPGTMDTVNAAPGVPLHVTMTHDGCRVLFDAKDATGLRRLYYAEREPSGAFGAPQQITTDPAAASWPALSDDGYALYFQRHDAGLNRGELYFLGRP